MSVPRRPVDRTAADRGAENGVESDVENGVQNGAEGRIATGSSGVQGGSGAG